MNLLRRVLPAALLALAAACAQAQATPDGTLYAPGAFDELEVDGAGEIRLSQGERDEVLVSGDSGARETLDLRLSGRKLLITVPGSWKFWRSNRLVIDVRMRQVRELTLSGKTDLHAPGPIKADRMVINICGSGNVRLDELTAQQLSFDISGAGEGQLAGKVERMGMVISGKGKLRAHGLRTTHANVSISGVGNAEVWATDELRVGISGAGRVDYRGEPALRQTISGVGSIRRQGEPR